MHEHLKDFFEVCDLPTEPAWRYLSIIAFFIIALMATVQNAVVCIVICKTEEIRTPTNILLATLAASDLLMGLIVAPSFAISQIIGIDEVSLYKFATLLVRLLGVIPLTIVMFISWDRFLRIRHLQKYNMTKKKLAVGLVASWTICLLIFVIILTCSDSKSKVYNHKAYIIVIFAVCLLSIIVAYSGILVMLRQYASQSNDAMIQSYIDNQKRAAKTASIIVIIFFAMNLPVILLHIMSNINPELCLISLLLFMANSVVNPIIYCSRIGAIKKHVKKFLRLREVRIEMVKEGSTDTGVSTTDTTV